MQMQARIDELQKKFNEKQNEMLEVMKNFGLAIVETRDDMRIINSYGDDEEMFKPAGKLFDRGESLFKAVARITKNTREHNPDGEEGGDIEQSVIKFVEGRRPEREFEILGEKDDGEYFLLIWRIVRGERYFKSFFKIVPSNNIVEKAKEAHQAELDQIWKNQTKMLNWVNDGLIIIDLKSRIKFMNENAKATFISADNKLLRNASIEGKNLKDLFAMDDPEELKKMLEYNNRVLITRKSQSFSKKVNDKEVSISSHPMFDEKQKVGGIFMVTSSDALAMPIMTSSLTNLSVDQKRLLATLKELAEDKRILNERVRELEYNQKWFMQNNKKYEANIKRLYSFLENVPRPLSIQKLPSLQYEFINKAMEKKLGKSRKETVGKYDRDIFPEKIVRTLEMKNSEAIDLRSVVSFRENGEQGAIIAMVDHMKNPAHIIRIFDK